jgi:hypothetical protein
MATNAPIKGKLIAVIGDEVIKLEIYVLNLKYYN